MSMFDVRYNDDRQWLAYADPDSMRVYAYVPNLDRFVFHRALTHEFYRGDDDTTFAAIDDADAATLIADPAELPRLDGRRHAHLLDELAAETDTRTPTVLLHTTAASTPPPSARQAAAAKARALRTSEPGTWMVWKTYDANDRHKALVAARDLRTGKVKALAELNVAATVGDPRDDGRWPVYVAIRSKKASAPAKKSAPTAARAKKAVPAKKSVPIKAPAKKVARRTAPAKKVPANEPVRIR